MNEQELREQIIRYGIRLVQADLVQGTWGNLSVRLDENTMLVTPSGMDYESLSPEEIVKVDIKTLSYEGSVKPTSEKALHQQIYLQKPEAKAVIHMHSDHCSVLAAANAPLPAFSDELKTNIGGNVAVAKYGLPGSDKLARTTVKAMGPNNAALMAHHGAVCCGDSLEIAYANCALLESAAKEYIGERLSKTHG